MIDTIPPDSYVLMLELQLRKILDKMPPGWPEKTVTLEIVNREVRSLLRVCPLGQYEELPPEAPLSLDLTPCQRQTLKAIYEEYARTGKRLQGTEVRLVMKAAGIHWSSSSVNIALAELVAQGLLSNHRDKRGYGPPDAD